LTGTPRPAEGPVGVAVVGAGYWGPNLIRNFLNHPEFDLRWVCDAKTERARAIVGSRSGIRIAASIDEVLRDDEVVAVAISTPPSTHAGLGQACLESGRHVLMEKPLATSVGEGELLVRL